jgi:hypothetical protein
MSASPPHAAMRRAPSPRGVPWRGCLAVALIAAAAVLTLGATMLALDLGRRPASAFGGIMARLRRRLGGGPSRRARGGRHARGGAAEAEGDDAAAAGAPLAALPPADAGAGAPSSTGGVHDPDPITVVYIACGNPNEVEADHFGLLNLKSLLMAKAQRPLGATPRRYEVHVVANVGAEELFNTTQVNYDVWRAVQRDPWVRVHVHDTGALDAATAAAGFADAADVPQTIFKNCAASRLKLPFLLASLGVSRAMYMDWDSVVLCDLTRIWDGFARFPPPAIMAFAPADPTGASELDHYRMWDLPRHPTIGSINSGVMLLRVPALMAVAGVYWAEVVAILEEGLAAANVTGGLRAADYWALTAAFPLGDQDVLNALFARHPSWLHALPATANFCLDLPPAAMPCVVHFCGNKLMPVNAAEAALPAAELIKNPWRAVHAFVRYWPLEPPEAPPGVGGGGVEGA